MMLRSWGSLLVTSCSCKNPKSVASSAARTRNAKLFNHCKIIKLQVCDSFWFGADEVLVNPHESRSRADPAGFFLKVCAAAVQSTQWQRASEERGRGNTPQTEFGRSSGAARNLRRLAWRRCLSARGEVRCPATVWPARPLLEER